MLRAEQLRLLRDAGMEVGAHTMTHPILASLDDAAARREIEDSRDALRSILGAPVTLFAYPNGQPGRDYRGEHVRMVKNAGFRAAWSTAHGAADRACDAYQIPRITAWQADPRRFAWSLARTILRGGSAARA